MRDRTESAGLPATPGSASKGATLLDPGAVTVRGLHFIGATLWTDFLLEGVAGEAWAHLEVGRGLSDFAGVIRHDGGRLRRTPARGPAADQHRTIPRGESELPIRAQIPDNRDSEETRCPPVWTKPARYGSTASGPG